MNHYAGVSKLKFSKEDKRINRYVKDVKKAATVETSSCGKFTMRELKRAMVKMKRRGAPGPDDITPAFLKELGPRALEVLLEIYNESFVSAQCPQVWRTATIIPLLKAGKTPKEIKSFRPISLTSCVVKLMERIVAERLYYIVESAGIIHRFQAGFRKGRSCEDQILKVVQAIENGFAKPEMERTVLVLLDFSSAYDTVWREKLLTSLYEQGIPLQFIRWLSCFLSNRVARVRLGDATSSARIMRQGLPQGAVLSPLLFVLYINNLAKLLPEEATNALFADDVTTACTDRRKEEAERLAQRVVDIVVNWSEDWKLKLNSSKSEVGFFSTYSHDAKWEPSITIGGSRIPYKKYPRMLGVHLDCQLSFVKQTEEAVKQASGKLKLLAVLANTEWGWRKNDLMMIYRTFIRSKLDYGAASWQPWLSQTSINDLDVVQNQALRLITGQPRSTPVDALRLEAGVSGYGVLIDRMCLSSVEKALRRPSDHPMFQSWQEAVPPKNQRSCWKARGDKLLEKIPEVAKARKKIPMYSCPPWQELCDLEVYTEIPGICGKDDPLQVKKTTTMARINSFKADFVIYSDGSATAGCSNGGAAAIVTRGVAESPVVLQELIAKGAAFTSSYEEELNAASMAVEWIADQDIDQFCLIVLATDSQSLCAAMSGTSDQLEPLLAGLGKLSCKLVIQWIPGHSDVMGNELADEAAKKAAKLHGPGRDISYESSRLLAKKFIPDPPPEHKRSQLVYSKLSRKREAEIATRSEQVTLARIRGGHHLMFGETRHRYNKEEDPRCPRCGHDIETMTHWLLNCPGTEAARQAIFGTTEVELSYLSEFPKKSLELTRRTLRGSAQG